MAISKKISVEDEAVRSLINKGGSVSNDKQTIEDKKKLLQLRIKDQLIIKIDEILKSGTYPKMSRHAWIIFAIESYLEQELQKLQLKK